MTRNSYNLTIANHMTKDKEAIRVEEGDERGADRGQWGNQVEFLLACVGYAVGLGNVWRFPYLAYENGGGAFLIPYVISLLVAGLPIFYMELCLGQFSSLGPNCIFGKIAPLMQGVGWGMITIATFVAIYYNMIIAWTLYYLAAAAMSVFREGMLLPWSGCRNDWNTLACSAISENVSCVDEHPNSEGWFFFNKTCHQEGSRIAILLSNGSLINTSKMVTPAEEYFDHYVLNRSEGIESMGGLEWKLALALLVAWVVVFLCLIKGVQSTGKVVYFTATFPYVVLIILFFRGITLQGAWEGIVFYIKPDLSRLADIKVWKAASTQIFYSLGPAFGSLLTMASYNKFNNNCYRDALIVSFTNCLTSVFAGFAIFSTMGFMAQELKTTVSEVVKNGPGLAFIAYPEAINRMPASIVWALLFFFMLFTLGLDSQFGMVEAVTTAVMDQFPTLRRQKSLVVLAACAIMFLLGLPMCMQNGVYVFTLFDNYSAGYCLVLVALCEFITAIYIYGISNFCNDITLMLGEHRSPLARIVGPIGYYWRITWSVCAPVMLTAILVCIFVFYGTSNYGPDYQFPWWADCLGWILSTISVLWIPGFAMYNLYRYVRADRPLSELLQPTTDWSPAHEREKAASIPMYSISSGMPPPVTPTSPYPLLNGSAKPPQSPSAHDNPGYHTTE